MRDGVMDLPKEGIDFDAFLNDQREEVFRAIAASAAQVRGGAGPDDRRDTSRKKARMTVPGPKGDVMLCPPLSHYGLPRLVGFPGALMPLHGACLGPMGVHLLPMVPGYTIVHNFVP